MQPAARGSEYVEGIFAHDTVTPVGDIVRELKNNNYAISLRVVSDDYTSAHRADDGSTTTAKAYLFRLVKKTSSRYLSNAGEASAPGGETTHSVGSFVFD